MLNVNSRKCISRLSRRTIKKDKTRNIIAILAIILTAVMFTRLLTIGASIVDSFQLSTMRQVGTKAHGGFKFLTQEQDDIVKDDPILAPLPENRHMYFVHSFYAKQCQEVLLADAEYESIRVPAIVGRGRVYGMQFHPEKSGAAGLQLLTNFARLLSR